jgi:TRAP-type C4-dicarboxylate transport system substrate-binding protein
MTNTTWVRRWAVVAATAALVLGSATVASAEGKERRIATLAPDGSAWMNILGKAAKDLRDKTAGRVGTKYYAGGVQGDERDVVRKMKLKQLDGAALTAVGMSLIYPGIRVMELPFLFQNVEEVDYVRAKTWPYFQEKFKEKGFHILAPGDVGWTYLYSNVPLDGTGNLGKVKMFAWQDDPIVRALFKRLKINGVPLGVPDALPALKTGRIDGTYGSPLAAVALQWYTEVKFATSLPVAYAVGALVIREEVWAATAPADQAIETEVMNAMGKTLVKRVRKDNERALKAMQKNGIKVIDTPPAMAKQFETEAHKVWQELAGSLYSKEELAMVIKYRDEYRAQAGTKKTAKSP